MSVSISREFIDKYNQPGPRYTSYPTVPVWTPDFGADQYTEALTELGQRRNDELAIYLHLPFCAKHCLYCGCNALVSREKGAVDLYLDRVEKEIQRVTELIGRGRRVVQLHWGGGTPNFLNEAQTDRTLGLFHTYFNLATEAEVSLEIDPRIATPKQVTFLHDLGFNRISLGIQDFDDRVQTAIGRMQPRKRTLDVYHGCRDAGFAGVNVDLVYGLPGQTAETFAQTLAEIIALEPDRVACFSYAHVPWVRPEQNKVDTTIMLDGYEKFALFQLTVQRFAEAGYTWIGIDHFAKDNDELARALRDHALHRNFMGYTTKPAPHMLAFGMSGIGDVCDRFVQNDADLTGWSTATDENRFPIVRGHHLNQDDRLRRKVIINLMCNLELPFSLTEAEFGAPANELLGESLDAIKPLADDGLVDITPDGLYITDKGRWFTRNVCMPLDPYLARDKDKPVFSKTI